MSRVARGSDAIFCEEVPVGLCSMQQPACGEQLAQERCDMHCMFVHRFCQKTAFSWNQKIAAAVCVADMLRTSKNHAFSFGTGHTLFAWAPVPSTLRRRSVLSFVCFGKQNMLFWYRTTDTRDTCSSGGFGACLQSGQPRATDRTVCIDMVCRPRASALCILCRPDRCLVSTVLWWMHLYVSSPHTHDIASHPSTSCAISFVILCLHLVTPIKKLHTDLLPCWFHPSMCGSEFRTKFGTVDTKHNRPVWVHRRLKRWHKSIQSLSPRYHHWICGIRYNCCLI